MTEIVIGIDASTRLLMQMVALIMPGLLWVAVALASLCVGMKIARLVAHRTGTK